MKREDGKYEDGESCGFTYWRTEEKGNSDAEEIKKVNQGIEN